MAATPSGVASAAGTRIGWKKWGLVKIPILSLCLSLLASPGMPGGEAAVVAEGLGVPFPVLLGWCTSPCCLLGALLPAQCTWGTRAGLESPAPF